MRLASSCAFVFICQTARARHRERQRSDLEEQLDCFVARAPRNDAELHSRGVKRPSYYKQLPSCIRGRRECRAPAAPVALRAKIKSTQASHHGHTGDIRHSPRNGFNGLLRGLPGDRAFLPPSPRNAKHCRELIPASRYQDATTSPSATRAFVSCACYVHRISCPTFCDDRETPLMRAEDARKSAGDLPVVASKKARGTLARPANRVARQKAVKGCRCIRVQGIPAAVSSGRSKRRQPGSSGARSAS
jgi:hypothetical protein